MIRFYVSLTWHYWPESGSYGTIVEADDADTAQWRAKLEMAATLAAEHGLCYYCGADTDNGEGSDGLCGDCADISSDEEGEPDPAKALEPTDAGLERMYVDYANDWHMVDCFDLDAFVALHDRREQSLHNRLEV